MKNVIFFFLITSSIVLFSQQDKLYYIVDIDEVNDQLALRLENYVELFSHKLNRNNLINITAKQRNNYFIKVVENTSKSGNLFSEMIDSIPHGKIGHAECFGKPNFFKAPKISYPEMFKTFSDLSIEGCGEIMYQVSWQNTLNEYQNSKLVLINKAIKEIKETYKVDKLSQKILDAYKNSNSHNKIIKEKGNGEYGISTMVIISEEKLENGKWFYELMIRNLIVFTRKIY
jgi:hypothetical protein